MGSISLSLDNLYFLKIKTACNYNNIQAQRKHYKQKLAKQNELLQIRFNPQNKVLTPTDYNNHRGDMCISSYDIDHDCVQSIF